MNEEILLGVKIVDFERMMIVRFMNLGVWRTYKS